MDAVTHPRVEVIVWRKSARVGYTKLLNHTIGYFIHQDPCSILLVQPTVDDAEGYSKEEIAPMLADTPVLRGVVSDPKSKDSSNTILRKAYPGGVIDFVGANSARGFRRVTKRIALFDEVSGYPPTAGQEGDQIKLGIRRTETFWNRKIVIGSTPTDQSTCRVSREIKKVDAGKYHVPCPHCDEPQVLEFKHLKWPDGKPLSAFFVCIHCGAAIEHSHKRWMVEHGFWRGKRWEYRDGEFVFDDEFDGQIGFEIWAAYSYSPNASWGKIAKEFLESKSEPDELKTFVNTVLGECWDDEAEEIDDAALINRREHYPVDVPAGAVLLTAAVDVQDDRLEVEVEAWAEDEENWTVDKIVIDGDPGVGDTWSDLDDALSRSYIHESGARMAIWSVTVDSGGHYTTQVYEYCKRRRRRRIFAIKGMAGEGRPIVSAPTRKAKGREKTKVPLFTVGTFEAKKRIFSRLRIQHPGPRYMHFPDESWCDEEYFAQLTAEKLVTRYKKGVKYQEWVKTRDRNEVLDLKVYNMAALHLAGSQYRRILREAAEKMAAFAPPDPPPQRPVSEQPKAPASAGVVRSRRRTKTRSSFVTR